MSEAHHPHLDPILPQLGQGYVWQDISVGQRWRTFRRTVTEADLVNFINATGMLEAIFIEEGFDGGAMKIHAPVIVGDTIGATVEITGVKPTSRSGRAVVDSMIEVFNQRGVKVMTYKARRLLAGRS
jgi:3-hydroxybutyryl-CoA dehydratase